MAIREEMKGRINNYMKGKGVDAPEEFLSPGPIDTSGVDESVETPVITLEEKIMSIKEAPDFDLVEAIKMLIADGGQEPPVEQPVIDETMAEITA